MLLSLSALCQSITHLHTDKKPKIKVFRNAMTTVYPKKRITHDQEFFLITYYLNQKKCHLEFS